MNRPSFRIWRPATTFILIGGLVVLLVALVVSFMLTNFKPSVEVRLGSGVYHLWLADTDAEREQGLSGVTSLRDDGGLLMRFDGDSTWGIWMKDMQIPLDIIWLDSGKKVVYMVKNADPSTGSEVIYTPKKPARYVVELPKGSIEKAGIKAGMTATFDETADAEYRQ